MRPTSRRLVAALCFLFVAPALLMAQATMEGRWSGSITTPHGAIPLQLALAHRGNEVTATYALTNAQSADLQPVTSVRLASDSVFVSVPLQTNLGAAVMRMRGTGDGPALAGDFETMTDDGLTVGNGTWRLERAARGGGAWERLPAGAPVSTADHHEGPSLFDEVGGRFYFTRASADFSSSRVLVLAREGEDPSPAPFSTGPYDAGLARSPDGDLEIFTSKRPTGDEARPDEWNLWAVTGDGTGAVPLPLPVNSAASECCAAFARDGTFLFSTDRDGSWDIYRALPAGAGAWTVRKLEGSLNSEGHEWPSQVARQDGMILFNSMRPGGFGGDDLFAACRQGASDRWEAVRLSATVNTDGYEDSGMLTPDGRTYFWSGRRRGAQGTADILNVDADRVGLPNCGAAED